MCYGSRRGYLTTIIIATATTIITTATTTAIIATTITIFSPIDRKIRSTNYISI